MTKRSYEMRHVVSFEETNLVGNVYFADYFSWQGRCREMFLRDHAPDVLTDLQAGILRLVTAHASCDFFYELTVFEEVCIRMTLNRFIPYGVSLGFEYGRAGSAQETLARGTQDIKFLRRNDGRWELFDIPPSLLEVFRRYE